HCVSVYSTGKSISIWSYIILSTWDLPVPTTGVPETPPNSTYCTFSHCNPTLSLSLHHLSLSPSLSLPPPLSPSSLPPSLSLSPSPSPLSLSSLSLLLPLS